MTTTYPIVPRIAAAEMGWTSEQFLPVLKRLAVHDHVGFDEPTSQVWVKLWWEHNSPRMAFAPKLRDRAMDQIAKIPTCWQDAFLADLRARIPDLYQQVMGGKLSTDREEGGQDGSSDTVSTPYPASQVRASKDGVPNVTKGIYNSIFNYRQQPEPAARSTRTTAAAAELEKLRSLTSRRS